VSRLDNVHRGVASGALLLAVSISGFAFAVVGAALCLDLVTLLSVCGSAVTAAAAAALVVSGVLARVAAAVGFGSVVGTLVMIVTVVVHAKSGCLVID
jgi:Na+/phosphate symporter